MVEFNANEVPLTPDELPDSVKRAAMRTVATRLEASGHVATIEALQMLGLIPSNVDARSSLQRRWNAKDKAKREAKKQELEEVADLDTV